MSEFSLKNILTPRGILRFTQASVNMIGAIFCLVSYATYYSEVKFFEFVGLTGFIIDLIFLAMELANISSQINKMPFIELGLNAIWILSLIHI